MFDVNAIHTTYAHGNNTADATVNIPIIDISIPSISNSMWDVSVKIPIQIKVWISKLKSPSVKRITAEYINIIAANTLWIKEYIFNFSSFI